MKSTFNTQSTRRGLLTRLGRDINYLLSSRSFRGIGKIRAAVTRFLIGTPQGIIICPTRHGFNLIIDPTSAETVDRNLYLKGTYEAGTLEIMRRCLRSGDAFIDIGSYIGLMSLGASKFVGNDGVVYAFEPEPTTFEILKKNVKLNEIRNIRAYNTALGSAKDRTSIYTSKDMKGSASLVKMGHEGFKSKEVVVDTLDNLVSAGSLSIDTAAVRMIKIDVEGWELEVLKGGKQLFCSQDAPIICLEYSTLRLTQGGDSVELYDFMVSINNYIVYKLEEGKEKVSKLVEVSNAIQLPRHDNLFCFRSEHLATVPPSIFRNR